MSNYKKWFLSTFIALVAILVILGSTVVIVDPFFHYHKPIQGLTYILNNQSYQNPGIAKHFEYDTLITGSSMTENFKPSYFKEQLGLEAVKLSYSGAYSKNMRIIMDYAIENNPQLSTVFLGLDLNMLKVKNYVETRNPLPLYLYNSFLFDDLRYVFNKEILFNYMVPEAELTIKNVKSTSLDDYSYWQDSFTFGQNALLQSITNKSKAVQPEYSMEEAIGFARQNLENNIVPVIENNPDKKFVIFMPPYSMAYWYLNYYEYDLAVIEYVSEMLTQYENVEFYFFLNEENIVSNMYNYKDVIHYSEEFNRYMVDSFKSKRHLLTKDNYLSEINKLENMIHNFDYDSLFGSTNVFLNEMNYTHYLDKLKDPRYVAIISASLDKEIYLTDVVGKSYENSESIRGKRITSVINGNEILSQTANDDGAQVKLLFNEQRIEVIADIKNGANFTAISINDTVYTTNQPGVNIVVYDTITEKVLDNISVNVETGQISRK